MADGDGTGRAPGASKGKSRHPGGPTMPTDPLSILDAIRIAAPCPASWAEMPGDNRARHCATCRKHVYDLSALTAIEAAALIERTEGRLCVRLYRRRDGTVLTADCPVGARARVLSRLRRLAVGGLVGLSLLLAAAFRTRGPSDPGGLPEFTPRSTGPDGLPDFTPPPTGPGVTLRDWRDWALESIGWFPRRGGVVMGEAPALPSPPTSPPAAVPTTGGSTCPASPPGTIPGP